MSHVTSPIAVLIACAACATTPPAPTQPPRDGVLEGTLRGRPFLARSALMTPVNSARRLSGPVPGKPGHSSTEFGVTVLQSEIKIYERVVTCADLTPARGEIERVAGERTVEVTLQGAWPVVAGSTFPLAYDGPADSKRDHATAGNFVGEEVCAEPSRCWVAGSGYGMFGALTVVEATPRRAVIAMKLATSDHSDAVAGTIPIEVCP
jgi:hypothetical protein